MTDEKPLYGHEETERSLISEARAGKLPHGLIISGPRGIGKSMLAHRLAHVLLGADKDPAMANRIAAGAHPDFMVIEPLFDEKKKEYAREISVDQAREIPAFLSLTPGESQWRVIIVDAADALNNSSANALLKILEEPPPQAILILISHAPGKLLPTIRSRCRILKLHPLSEDDFRRAMIAAAPDIDNIAIAPLAELSGHAPGAALEMQEQGIEWYGEILDLLASLPAIDTLKLHAFAEQVQANSPHANWRLLTRLMLVLFERIAKQSASIISDPITDKEPEILSKLAKLHPPAVWATKWQQAADQFFLTERLHLDYKQVTIAFFHGIAGKDGFQLVA